MKDKLEDLFPWVTKLKDSLTKANPKSDREEAERRTQLAKFALHLPYPCHVKLILCRSLDDIEKQSQMLLEKGKGRMGKVVRILDKTQDAQAVVGLFNQLQKAIVIYQVCVNGYQLRAKLTRVITDGPTTIDPQPGCAVDSTFLGVVFALILTGWLSV